MRQYVDLLRDEDGHAESGYAIRLGAIAISSIAFMTIVQAALVRNLEQPWVHVCFSGLFVLASVVFFCRYTLDVAKPVEYAVYGGLGLAWACASAWL